MTNPTINSFPVQINLTDPISKFAIKPAETGFRLAFGIEARSLPTSIAEFEAFHTTYVVD